MLDLAEEWPTSAAIESLKIGKILKNTLRSVLFCCSNDNRCDACCQILMVMESCNFVVLFLWLSLWFS